MGAPSFVQLLTHIMCVSSQMPTACCAVQCGSIPCLGRGKRPRGKKMQEACPWGNTAGICASLMQVGRYCFTHRSDHIPLFGQTTTIQYCVVVFCILLRCC